MTPPPALPDASRYCCPRCRGPVDAEMNYPGGLPVPRLVCRNPHCVYTPRRPREGDGPPAARPR